MIANLYLSYLNELVDQTNHNFHNPINKKYNIDNINDINYCSTLTLEDFESID